MADTQRKTTYRKWPFVVGTVFLLLALGMCLLNYINGINAAEKSQTVLDRLSHMISVNAGLPEYILDPDMPMPTKEIDGELYVGIISMQSIGIELPVLAECTDQGLSVAPGLYFGTIYKRNAVIAAHNFSKHFGRITELGVGDPVKFTDVNGNEFNYQVTAREIIQPYDIETMTESGAELSLFTCTPGGGSRFTVRCMLDDLYYGR